MSEEKKNYSLSTILIIGLTVCVLFLLFSVTIFRYQLNKIFEARCEKIRATGEPITLQELSPFYGEVPDDENAALIYEDIFNFHKRPSETFDIYIQKEIAKGIPEDKVDFKINYSFVEENILFLGCSEPLITGNKLPENVKKATRIFLYGNKRCLDLSRQTEQYSKCKFNIDFCRGYDMVFPHLYSSKEYVKLLAVDMNYASFKGDSDRVLMDFREGMKLGEYILNEPICISFSEGYIIDNLSIEALKTSYSRVKFTDLQLKEIEIILKEHIKLSSGDKAYIGGRAFCNSMINVLDKHRRYTTNQKRLYKFAPFFGVDTLWKLKCLDFFDEFFKIEKERDFTKKQKLSEDLFKKYDNLSFIYDPLDAVMSVFFSISDVEFDLRIKLTTALIAIEVERYKLKYHKLPKSLNDLVPEFFEKLPIDPFGKPYKYLVGKFDICVKDTVYFHSATKKINGFVIYSAMRNGSNDNAEYKTNSNNIVFWIIDKEKNLDTGKNKK